MREQLEAALQRARERSVQTYLHRQRIQQDAMRVQQMAVAADQELVRLDGEIAAYESLIAEASKAPKVDPHG
jgi:DNA-binding helix-hairpin-helix protein with protein kinase domain